MGRCGGRSTGRSCNAGMPCDLRLAFCIGIGKAQVLELHVQIGPVDLPLRLPRQPVDRDDGLLEQAGQVQRTLRNAHGRRATGLAGVEFDNRAAYARHADGRGDRWPGAG